MKNQRLVSMALVAASLGLATGCTSMSRGLGKMTANKYANARSGSVWVVPPPQLEPLAPDQKTVYVSWRNISDSTLDMTEALRTAAVNQGWTLVSDPTQANYRMRASCRFFGEVEPESGGAKVAEQMGWISGAAVGVGTGILVANATDSWGAGAVAGGAAGGLMGMGISNASKPREWALIIDIVLEERSDEEITFELTTDNSSSGTGGGGVGNSRMTDSGGTTTGNTTSGRMSKTSNYYPHGVRLSSWANQMNMDEEEALPLVEERAAKVITQILPQ